MSKRYFPQHVGDRKRAKLDISVSDHNFPLSQNKEAEPSDNWGDDDDDEILLLASQACEQACSSDLSLLPDYSVCMQPATTSTQVNPQPSTSKTPFTFKKPTPYSSSIVSTNLKDKCPHISSPLPGITSKAIQQADDNINLTDDLIFNDRVFQGPDSEQVYRQLLQLREENAKLKSENGKLLEKCVTKEGEASILRTQLKTCQVAVDKARMEKVRAQEKVHMEWTEKLNAANNQMSDLRNQLDFKNMEIISIKEKCKKLESTKVRLTQVTLNNSDISQRHNNSYINENQSHARVQVTSACAQTDNTHKFITLNKNISTLKSPLLPLLPHILEPCINNQYFLLDYNENLSQKDGPHKCLVYNTFHRVPNTPGQRDERRGVQINTVYEDVVSIANGSCDKCVYFNLFKAISSILLEIINRLEAISKRMTTAFQKEMDEKYIETSTTYIDVTCTDLLKGSALYNEEQDILGRRLLAVLSYVVNTSTGREMCAKYHAECDTNILNTVLRICTLIDHTSTATLYSGLLSSITLLLTNLPFAQTDNTFHIMKTIITSRPQSFVIIQLLELIVKASELEAFRNCLCPNSSAGNLKTDHDQGVLLYKKESCHIQVYLRQVESCVKCIGMASLGASVARVAAHLISLHNNINTNDSLAQDNIRCDCQLLLIQVVVYTLRTCAVMLDSNVDKHGRDVLLSSCHSGIHMLYRCWVRELEFSSQLPHHEGHLAQFCDIMAQYTHGEVYGHTLSELAGALQSAPEDMPPSFHKQPWLKSFQTLSMAD